MTQHARERVSVVEGVRILGAGPIVDILVKDGVIAEVVRSSTTETSLVCLPSFVDLHTHLRQPGGDASETMATGTRAAAAGGYSDVFTMANTQPVIDSVHIVEKVRALAEGTSARVWVNSAATYGLAGQELVDIVSLRKAGVELFSDDGHCLSDEGLVFELLQLLAQHGGVFAQHAQSPSIVGPGVINAPVAAEAGCPPWPPAGEEAIIARDIALARASGGRLHLCHVSTKGSVDLIRWAKSVGAPVTAEVTPHHLVLSDRDALRIGSPLKVNPPLRSREDIAALREALLDGTIDVVGTDHAPHPSDTKVKGWNDSAFGMTALETALPVIAEVFEGSSGVDWSGVSRVMSSMPALIGGIQDRAGLPLEQGSPANFCVIEQGGPWTVRGAEHHSLSANTPFEGTDFRHRVVLTVLDGVVTHRA